MMCFWEDLLIQAMNKRNIKILLCLLLLGFAFNSCKKDDVIIPYNPIEDFNYYPMKVGSFIEYNVEYVFWNDFNHTIDTSNYILRELIESVMINYTGDSLFRIERNTKEDPDSAWSISRIWFSGYEDNYAFKMEENIKYVKLIVPVKKNVQWEGNILNDLEPKTYKYVSIDQPLQFNNLTFPKCAKILQDDFETLINKDYEEEIYARNVGLIFKKQIHVNKTYNQITQRFEITSGYLLVQTIRNYGNL